MRFYCDKLVLGEVSLVLHIIKEGTLNPRISALRISGEKLKPHVSNFNAWFNFFNYHPPPPPKVLPQGLQFICVTRRNILQPRMGSGYLVGDNHTLVH